MSFVVEMIGRSADPELHLFSCSNKHWEDFQHIGRSYGWQPAGTKPLPRPPVDDAKYMDYFRPDYHPDEWSYAKTVDAADAKAWAEALRRAAAAFRCGVDRGHALQNGESRDDLGVLELRRLNVQRATLLERFARFLATGDFSFAWDR